MKQTAVVVGLGEVGRPLLELVERAGHTAVGVDIEPASIRRVAAAATRRRAAIRSRSSPARTSTPIRRSVCAQLRAPN
jgi:Trk K+ transport system NAD-binding subunit